MLVVNDCQLPEARSSLVDMWSEHVYSVQKMKTITDFQLLYAVDPLETTRYFIFTYTFYSRDLEDKISFQVPESLI